jgi:hypothetical protein
MQKKKIEPAREAAGLSVEELNGQRIELVPDRIEMRRMRRRRRHHHDFDGGAVGGIVDVNGGGDGISN